MDSRSNQIWCGCNAARIQHPGVKGNAYGCPSFASVLVAKESVADVFRRVVVRVVRVAALQTLERVLRRTVILVGEAARRTPPRRVCRVHLPNHDTTFFRLVLGVGEQAAKRPRMESLCAGHPFADVGQILERDVRTAAFVGFINEFIRHSVQQLLEPPRLLGRSRERSASHTVEAKRGASRIRGASGRVRTLTKTRQSK